MTDTKQRPLYARNISYLRNIQNLTIKDIAAKAGINERTWYAYEEGRAFPNKEKFSSFCKALNYFDILSIVNTDLSKAS